MTASLFEICFMLTTLCDNTSLLRDEAANEERKERRKAEKVFFSTGDRFTVFFIMRLQNMGWGERESCYR